MYKIKILIKKEYIKKYWFIFLLTIITLFIFIALLIHSNNNIKQNADEDKEFLTYTDEPLNPIYLSIEDRKNIKFGNLEIKIKEGSSYEFNTMFKNGLSSMFFCNNQKSCFILEVSNGEDKIYFSYPSTIAMSESTDDLMGTRNTENLDQKIGVISSIEHIQLEHMSMNEENNLKPNGNKTNYKSFICIADTCLNYFYQNIFDIEDNQKELENFKSFLHQLEIDLAN